MKKFYSFLFLAISASAVAVTEDQAQQHRFGALLQKKLGYQQLLRNEPYIKKSLLHWKEKIEFFEEDFATNLVRLEEALLQDLEALRPSSSAKPFIPLQGITKGFCFLSMLKKGPLSEGWLALLQSLYEESRIEYAELDTIKETLEVHLSLNQNDDQVRWETLCGFLSCYNYKIEELTPTQIALINSRLQEAEILNPEILGTMQSYLRLQELEDCLTYIKGNGQGYPYMATLFETRKEHLRQMEKDWILSLYDKFQIKHITEENFVHHDLFVPTLWKEDLFNEELLEKLSQFSIHFQELNEDEEMPEKLNRLMGLQKDGWIENIQKAYFKDVEKSAELIQLLEQKKEEIVFFDEGDEVCELTQAVSDYFCLEAVRAQFLATGGKIENLPLLVNEDENPDFKHVFSQWARTLLEADKIQTQKDTAYEECVQHRMAIQNTFSELKALAYQGFLAFLDTVEKEQAHVKRKADWSSLLTIDKNLLVKDLRIHSAEELVEALVNLFQNLLKKNDSGFDDLLSFEAWIKNNLVLENGLNKRIIPFLLRVECDYFEWHEPSDAFSAYLQRAFDQNPYFEKSLLKDEVSFFSKNMIRHMYSFVQKNLFAAQAARFEEALENVLSWEKIQGQIQKIENALQNEKSLQQMPSANVRLIPQILKTDVTYQDFLHHIDQLYPRFKALTGPALAQALANHFALSCAQGLSEERLLSLENMQQIPETLRFFDAKFVEEIEFYFKLKDHATYIAQLLVL